MDVSALSCQRQAGHPSLLRSGLLLLLLLGGALALGPGRLEADPPGTASATATSASANPGSASASAGEVSSTTNTDYPAVAQSNGGVDATSGNWTTSVTNGNNTPTKDKIEIVCNNAKVRTKAQIIDADHSRASYIRGQGTSKEEFTYTVTATDEEARVYLKISNPFQFKAKWRGQGKKYRTVNNRAWVKDIYGAEHTFDLILTYGMDRTTSTQFTVTASVTVQGVGNPRHRRVVGIRTSGRAILMN